MGSVVSRRHFLLTSAAAPAAVALAAPASADAVHGRVAPGRARVDTHPAFAQAARRYHVPAALLAALSYAQTRWQDHDGRPSTSRGYGPMHLVDGAAATRTRDDLVGKSDPPAVIDTLGEAARASGLTPSDIRRDPDANIAATAALLARVQRTAGRRVGVNTEPADWYAAVAAVSGLTSPAAQLDLADHVLSVVGQGGRLDLADGSRLFVPARRVGPAPRAQREPIARRAAQARRRSKRDRRIDAPRGLDVEWYGAAYEQYGSAQSDYGNHDLARRPHAPTISHIVIHDTEASYQETLKLIKDPTYVSWQYTLRSRDGHVAQHVAAHNIAWHAGNWWMNIHSIGLEHEGFAADGPAWFSEPLYRASARLVRYLAHEYKIPLDRAHVIGHDQVPGPETSYIPGMHWDPGPFWDWEHYFELLGAPLHHGTHDRRPHAGDVVRILPGFAGNRQPVTGCDSSGDDCDGAHDTNFVTLRRSPSAGAALVKDIGQHPDGGPSTTAVADVSARAAAGVEYVVAKVDGDWTGIWFLGQLAWFHNPRRRPTARVVHHPPRRVRARGAHAAKVYGRAYPEASAYADPDDVQAVSPLVYTLPAGHEYVMTDAHPVTDYYKATSFTLDDPNDHVDIVGQDRYYQISLGHRVAFVRAADVEVVR